MFQIFTYLFLTLMAQVQVQYNTNSISLYHHHHQFTFSLLWTITLLQLQFHQSYFSEAMNIAKKASLESVKLLSINKRNNINFEQISNNVGVGDILISTSIASSSPTNFAELIYGHPCFNRNKENCYDLEFNCIWCEYWCVGKSSKKSGKHFEFKE